MSPTADPTAAAAEYAQLVRPERLGPWMDEQGLPGTGEPITYRFLSGGSQNAIFEIRRGELRCAMRRPPLQAPPGRSEGILREWRIIDALTGTDVPHTEAVAVCTDPDVVGDTFYLMGFVDGWSPMDHSPGWPAPFDTDVAARRGLAFQLVEGIAHMAAVDWKAKGLGDLGRPDGYHERQVERWTRFLDRVRTRELPGLDLATDWLRTHKPIDFVPGLMHGDYQFANVMFEHGAPARLAAIVDWEMGTIGDPKIDLAWVVQAWPEDTSAARGNTYMDLSGMPSKTQLLQHFHEVSGRQVDDMDYYVILGKWKLGIVLEQGYARVSQGQGDPKQEAFGPIVLDLLQGAADLAETTDYRGPTA